MKKAFALSFLALSALASFGMCDTPCCQDACTTCKPTIHVEVSEFKYPAQIFVVPTYTSVKRVVEKEMPVTRCVPVTVTDPCTGCTRTESHQETVMQKVKTTVIDVIPPTECPHCETIEKTGYCIKLNIGHVSAPSCCSTGCCSTGCCR